MGFAAHFLKELIKCDDCQDGHYLYVIEYVCV